MGGDGDILNSRLENESRWRISQKFWALSEFNSLEKSVLPREKIFQPTLREPSNESSRVNFNTERVEFPGWKMNEFRVKVLSFFPPNDPFLKHSLPLGYE